MRAHLLLRDAPWYRRDVFARGLSVAGHAVTFGAPDKPNEDTLLVLWNRYADGNAIAEQVENAGGKVIVAENGYIGEGGTHPKFDVHPGGPKPHHYYALANNWHNGGGTWNVGAEDRWSKLGIEIKDWRQSGEYILVCPNRSFGVPGRMMPVDWAERIAKQLTKEYALPVRIRAHPGNDSPKHVLSNDLKGAAMVVVWSSSCGVHAMVEGIPVLCEAPYWICKSAAPTVRQVAEDAPHTLDREAALRALAWAQWRCDEIATGEPFKVLLQ